MRSAALAIFDRLLNGSGGRRDPGYVFEPERLREIAQVGVGLPPAQSIAAVHRELRRQYPDLIAENLRFILNDAGASLGELAILYGSPKEYVLIFGSPIATGGYTGRYDAEVYDITLSGEVHGFLEGDLERSVYGPGEMRRLGRGEAGGYRVPDGGWMLEYARGNILTMFPFGVLAPAMFLTLDSRSTWAQLSEFTRQVLRRRGPERLAPRPIGGGPA